MQDTSAETSPEPVGMLRQTSNMGGLAAQLAAAAVGSVSTAHYLSAFARFDVAGRALPLWNWAAALALPCWLAFRGLWRWLGGCLVLLLGMAAVLWVAHEQAWLPDAMLAGVALALWLAGAVALGLWGDALVYRQLHGRIEEAVTQAATMPQAMARLQASAPTRRRLWLVAAAGALLVAVIALLVWQLGSAGAHKRVAARGEVAVTGNVTAAPQPPAPPKPPVPAPQPAPVEIPGLDVQEAQEVQGETDAALAALAASAQKTAAGHARKAKASTPQPAAPAPAQKVVRPAKPAKAAAAADAEPAEGVRKLYINVGVFADPANVSRVRERLDQAGLPVEVAAFRASDDKALQRVRVGPFASAARANEAAAKVRSLGLDAAPAQR